MKKLGMKKTESIEGGWSMINGCNVYAAYIVVTYDSVGTAEGYILARLAFDSCMGF